jgi:hypothetical protein
MPFLIKNIILYDPMGVVTGFVEVCPKNGKTYLRLKQSLGEIGMLLTVVTDGENKVFPIDGAVNEYTVDGEIDLEYEIFACMVKRDGEKVITIAGGAINLNKLKRAAAVKEIDSVLKKVCSVDDIGRGECDKCPYREYFFK